MSNVIPQEFSSWYDIGYEHGLSDTHGGVYATMEAPVYDGLQHATRGEVDDYIFGYEDAGGIPPSRAHNETKDWFKKKDPAIQAFRLGYDDTPDWFFEAVSQQEELQSGRRVEMDRATITIHTPDGEMGCGEGDWIIKESNGLLFTCYDNIFSNLYEKA